MGSDESEEGLSEERRPLQREYNVGWVPVLATLFFFLAMFVPYGVGVSNGHFPSLLPYISDGGAHPPERCYQTLFFSIAVYFLFHTFLIRQQLFLEFYGNYGRSGRYWRFLVHFNFFISLCSLVGVLLVSSFSETDSLSVHNAGAMITFLAVTLYIWIDIGLTLFLRPSMARRFTRLIRLCLALIATTTLVLHEVTLQANVFLPVGVPPDTDTGDTYTLRKYPPDSPYFANHVVSTGTEWVMVISFFIYFLTFVDEFMHTRVTLPSLTYIG